MKKSFGVLPNIVCSAMAKVCHLTGKKPTSGHNVSHSVRRTKRRFLPNLQWKRMWDPISKSFIRIRVSMSALRTLNKPMTKREEARLMKKMEKKEEKKAAKKSRKKVINLNFKKSDAKSLLVFLLSCQLYRILFHKFTPGLLHQIPSTVHVLGR